MMRTTKILVLATILLCRSGFGDQADTNAATTRATSLPEKPTRVWISSFEPITITTDYQVDLPRRATPTIPQSMAIEWRTNYALFSQHLLSAAENGHLDSGSLKKILSAIWDGDSSDLAILPVEAICTRYEGETVWVVGLRWENKGLVGNGYLDHIRSFTYSRETLKLVTMQSCD
jgi:hypothetical protein